MMNVVISNEGGLSNRSLSDAVAKRFVRDVAKCCSMASRAVEMAVTRARKPTSIKNIKKTIAAYRTAYAALICQEIPFTMKGRKGYIFIRLNAEGTESIEVVRDILIERTQKKIARQTMGIRIPHHFIAAVIRRLNVRSLTDIRSMIYPYVSCLGNLTMAEAASGACGRYYCIVPGQGFIVFDILMPVDRQVDYLDLEFVTCVTENLYYEPQRLAVSHLAERSPGATCFVGRGDRLPSVDDLEYKMRFESAYTRRLVVGDESMVRLAPDGIYLPGASGRLDETAERIPDNSCVFKTDDGVIKEVYVVNPVEENKHKLGTEVVCFKV